jgi:hypothetical protein
MAVQKTRLRPVAPQEGVRGDDGAWRSQIVELHVLAEHGDIEAASAAERWMATDRAARRLWDEVDTDCREIRNGVPGV